MKEAISDKSKIDFEEFTNKAKISLDDKLRNNPTMQGLNKAKEEYDSVVQAFDKIANTVPTPAAQEPSPEPQAEPSQTPEPA